MQLKVDNSKIDLSQVVLRPEGARSQGQRLRAQRPTPNYELRLLTFSEAASQAFGTRVGLGAESGKEPRTLRRARQVPIPDRGWIL
jgi:hypothetical protein